MLCAIGKEFGENFDRLFDFGEIKSFQQVGDISHILLTFFKIRDPERFELERQHVSSCWYEDSKPNIFAHSWKSTKCRQVTIRLRKMAQVKCHGIIEPRSRPVIFVGDAFDDIRKPSRPLLSNF